MSNVVTMARRDLGAYFHSPIAYAVGAIFLFTTGLAFALGSFQPGAESSLRSLLQFWVILVLLIVLPTLTMRLISEELHSGTIETLMTAPITEAEVILGKFVGAMVFYLALLATLLIYPVLMAMYGDVDLLLLSCNFIGLLFLGGLYVAVGLFFSTVTKHQVIAVLLTWSLLFLMTFASHQLAQQVEGWPRTVLQHVSVITHFRDFVRGMLDTSHVIFFLSTTGLFLFLSVKMLEVRRWR